MGVSAFEHIKQKYKKLNGKVDLLRILALVLLLILMFFPFSMDKMSLVDKSVQPRLLFPFTAAFSGIIRPGFTFLYFGAVSLFLLPIAFILMSVAVFVKKINKKALYICLVCAITGYLFAVVSAIVAFANTPRWFTSLSPLVYIAFFIGLCFHIFLVARGIVFKARQDEDYAEYNAILFEQAQEEIAANNKAIERLKARQEKLERGSPEYIKLEKMTKKYIEGLKHKNRKTHIKTKITLVLQLWSLFRSLCIAH